MKSHEFCYWLQGLFEIADPETLNKDQTAIIKRHLDMVFFHDIDRRDPPELQAGLQAIHDGALSPENPQASPFQQTKPYKRPPAPDGTLFRC